MKVINITTADNLKAVLATQNTYFKVKTDITLEGIQYTLGRGSVIEFQGGSFIGSTSRILLDLNGGQVIAASYPIFSNMKVKGFSNSRVIAEWFNDNNNTPPHIYINKALSAANGCPVVLSQKEYRLTGTIVFPQTSASTLISEGTLIIDKQEGSDEGDTTPVVAIDINTSNVSLDIKDITGIVMKPVQKNDDGMNVYSGVNFVGTGIRISGEVFHVSVNVNALSNLDRGIDISPGRKDTYANIQYLNIKFQKIIANHCIYIDVFSNGDPTANWLTRSSIHGGRLIGFNGIYIEDKGVPVKYNYNHISEMRFANIGLEEISGTPLRLCYATRLRFEYIRMAESLPSGGTWIYLKEVSRVSFSINGSLDADRYVAEGRCDHVIIQGSVLQARKWHQSPFDAILIDTVAVWDDSDKEFKFMPQKAATYSISPFQMTNAITQNSDLPQILPTLIPPVAGGFGGLKVLPQMLQFKIGRDTTIDLTGLQDYASCLHHFYVERGAGAKLTFQSSDEGYGFPRYIDNMNLTDPPSNKVITENGLHQLMWVTYTCQEEGKDEKGIEDGDAQWAAYIKKTAE